MRDCWLIDPNARPTFESLSKDITKIMNEIQDSSNEAAQTNSEYLNVHYPEEAPVNKRQGLNQPLIRHVSDVKYTPDPTQHLNSIEEISPSYDDPRIVVLPPPQKGGACAPPQLRVATARPEPENIEGACGGGEDMTTSGYDKNGYMTPVMSPISEQPKKKFHY